MKSLLLALALAAPDHAFQYRRSVTISPGAASQACAVLDPDTFAHAAPSLADLRLFAGNTELPYALTISEAAATSSDVATLQNLGRQGDRIVFDLGMPSRPYTDVDLHLQATNFLAIASVSGLSATGASTALGTYTLYDLSAQHLARNTTLSLQESTFPRLHVSLSFIPIPGASRLGPAIVSGAAVPPSREAQRLFTPVAQTSTIEHTGPESIARFTLPARVPIERISFLLAAGTATSFSRDVLITGHLPSGTDGDPEKLTGTISRVHLTEAGHDLNREQLSIPAVLGVNMQAPATLDITIVDGDDRPLPLAAVQLEMRQRKLCFPPPAAPLELLYGDPGRPAPVYDFSPLFLPDAATRLATLGPEQRDPGFHPRADTRTVTERHPELLWIVLIAVIFVLATVAFRGARHHPR